MAFIRVFLCLLKFYCLFFTFTLPCRPFPFAARVYFLFFIRLASFLQMLSVTVCMLPCRSCFAMLCFYFSFYSLPLPATSMLTRWRARSGVHLRGRYRYHHRFYQPLKSTGLCIVFTASSVLFFLLFTAFSSSGGRCAPCTLCPPPKKDSVFSYH